MTDDLAPLPSETLATVHANALEWMKIRVATSQDLRKAISDLERFTGEIGELNHFLKGGDRLIARIEEKIGENLLNPGDAEALKAALICRVKRKILNQIQADEETSWMLVKERLKKAYGSGRWTHEEDIFQMFRETKSPRQTNGQYAGTLLTQFNQVTEKMRETLSASEVDARMAFLATILKVQLARETGKKEGLPRERSFIECAREMIDASAREEDSRMEIEETPWNRVSYRSPRPQRNTWKRRETTFDKRERKPAQYRPRANGRREDRKCHGCGKAGHLVAQCPQTKCFECGTEGHIARQCPYMYSRARGDQPRGEPMEVNAQSLRRQSSRTMRSEPATDSTEESGNSSSEGETEEPGRRGNRSKVERWNKPSKRWRVDSS